MRALSYVIALVLVLTSPWLAGSSSACSADQNLPGIGTFAYSGSPIASSTSQIVASLGH